MEVPDTFKAECENAFILKNVRRVSDVFVKFNGIIGNCCKTLRFYKRITNDGKYYMR